MLSIENILSDEYDPKKVVDLCRLCGKYNESALSIFSETNHFNYAKVINTHFKDEFMVDKTDVLPLKLCSICLAKMMSWHEFYRSCAGVNQKFQQLVNKLRLNSEKKELEKVTFPTSNEIEVIEVSVDTEHYDLFKEPANDFDISNVNIKETRSLDDDDFSHFDTHDDLTTIEDPTEKITDNCEPEKTTETQNEKKNAKTQKNKVKKSTVCRICGKLYTNRSTYLHHLQKHPVHNSVLTTVNNSKASKPSIAPVRPSPKRPANLVPEICYMCGKTFRHSSSYRNHLKFVHAADPTKVKKPKRSRRMCELCGKILTNSTFKSHMRKHTNPESLKCEECGKTFAYVQTLRSHVQTCHTNERPFSCNFCPGTFKRADYLRSHIRYKHSENMEGIFKCPYCDNIYKTQKFYLAHMKTHDNDEEKIVKPRNADKKFWCQKCNIFFKKRNYLLLHERYVHVRGRPYSISENAEGQYKCDKCDKRFSSMSGRNYHCKRTHGTIFDNHFSAVCDHCGMTFKNRVFYARHKAKLNGLPTCYLCWQEFPTDDELAKHIDLDHFTDLPFVCEICRQRFVALKNLNHHLRSKHFNDKPFKCDLCPHRSARKDAIEIHIRGCHLGEKPFQCSICNKRFSQRTDLRKHEVRHTRNK